MECDSCGSDRVCSLSAKCSDMFGLTLGDLEIENDYVPGDFGIGGGDYIRFDHCLDCGKIQGEFPLDVTELEMDSTDKDEDDDEEDPEDEGDEY